MLTKNYEAKDRILEVFTVQTNKEWAILEKNGKFEVSDDCKISELDNYTDKILARIANGFNTLLEPYGIEYGEKDSFLTDLNKGGVFEDIFNIFLCEKILLIPWFDAEGELLRYVLIPIYKDIGEEELNRTKTALTMTIKILSALEI